MQRQNKHKRFEGSGQSKASRSSPPRRAPLVRSGRLRSRLLPVTYVLIALELDTPPEAIRQMDRDERQPFSRTTMAGFGWPGEV